MTTYTAIANSDVDQNSPITETLMTLLRDNPIAIAEQSSGAPRIATRNRFGVNTGTSLEFTGLEGYKGAAFFFTAHNITGVSSNSIYINAYKSEGTPGYGSGKLLFTIPAGGTVTAHGYWNKKTGVVEVTFLTSTPTAGVVTQTNTYYTDNGNTVTQIIFTATNTSINMACHLMPDGGESID